MTGVLLLEGGAEFGGRMAEPDRQALVLAGGLDAPVRIVPAAAAPDRNDRRVGRIAAEWFRQLGARNVDVVPAIDTAAANDPLLAAELRAARLIYLPGGFPAYLARTLAGSRCWEAIVSAYQDGAVLGGSSAGAMVLCQYLYDPSRATLIAGLGLLPDACVMPHYDTYGASWQPALRTQLPNALLIGLDERTGAIGTPGGEWEVYGQGALTVDRPGDRRILYAGERMALR